MNPIPFSRLQLMVPTVAGVLALASALPCAAGGPIDRCAAGVPLIWPAGGVGIPFNPDQGGLGALSNPDAVALVTSAFSVWQAVPTSTVTYANAGLLPVDVDITNFGPYLNAPAPDGYSAIVFDDTGEIFDVLFGPGSGILGFAGPEWLQFATCEIVEGVSFLNGPAFTNPVYAYDVMVHEFGHYSGLGHTVVNGQIYIGDTTGPTPNNAFGPAPDPFASDVVETMYPFYFGPGVGTGSPEKDDVSALSALYPEAGYAAGSGTIRGTILLSDGVTPITGVNVIARNLANPFEDAVSAISGDYSAGPGDAFHGVYTLTGLTPGASYAVYVDQIFAGGFSTPPAVLPGPEEFYNGAAESNNLTTPDNPQDLSPVPSVAGGMTDNIDVIFNGLAPGLPLPVGDDGSAQIPLPFSFRMINQWFNDVWVNANGNVTFGGPDGDFDPSVPKFLDGRPRIAGLWIDLNPDAGGFVTFQSTPDLVSIIWNNVPVSPAVGANSFTIKLHRLGNLVSIEYGALTATSGIAGLAGGSANTAGTETPADLSPSTLSGTRLGLWMQPAIFESFGGGFDLAGRTLRMQHEIDYNDRWAGSNNTFATAKLVAVPFLSAPMRYYTEIEPVAGDVDFFSFNAAAGQPIRVEVTRGALDSLIGLFGPAGELLAFDDDSGPGLLSSLTFLATETGVYRVAATTYPDFGFTGAGGSGGRYVLRVRVGGTDPKDLLVNGSFELDTFGWTASVAGEPFIPWTVSEAGAGAGFDMAPTSPQDGDFVLWNGFDGDGPMQFTLYQDVAIPAGIAGATLSWKDRVQWNYFVAAQTQPRTYAVEIRNPFSNATLDTLYSFSTGIADGLGDTGWVSHSVDVSAHIGSTIRVWFEENIPESFTGPGQIELDAVSLKRP